MILTTYRKSDEDHVTNEIVTSDKAKEIIQNSMWYKFYRLPINVNGKDNPLLIRAIYSKKEDDIWFEDYFGNMVDVD